MATSRSFVCSNGIEFIAELQVAGSSNFGVDDEIEMLVAAFGVWFLPWLTALRGAPLQAGFDLEWKPLFVWH